MCYIVTIFHSLKQISQELGLDMDESTEYTPYYFVSGFVQPMLPLIPNDTPNNLHMAKWGLIPSWVKDEETAKEISIKTLNARSETAFKLPSFRNAMRKQRALLPVNGFVEWRHDAGVKQPYFVHHAAGELLTLGALWEEWTHRETGELLRTFSILTTQSNKLMSYIHNTKNRMPVVIKDDDRYAWLSNNDPATLEALMQPLEEGILEAYPISRDANKVKVEVNDPHILDATGEIVE